MTALEIILSAYATSRHNDPEEVADEAGALLDLLNAELRGVFAEGAKINRRFFGHRFEVPKEGEGWARPRDATRIERLELGNGTEVVVLPVDQRHIEPHRPAVYSWGQQWRPAGRDNDPDGSLVVLACRLPEELEDLEAEVDSLFPLAFRGLLKWPLAIYLASKDGERDTEVATFSAQLAREHERFVAFLEGEDQSEVREYGYGGGR